MRLLLWCRTRLLLWCRTRLLLWCRPSLLLWRRTRLLLRCRPSLLLWRRSRLRLRHRPRLLLWQRPTLRLWHRASLLLRHRPRLQLWRWPRLLLRSSARIRSCAATVRLGYAVAGTHRRLCPRRCIHLRTVPRGHRPIPARGLRCLRLHWVRRLRGARRTAACRGASRSVALRWSHSAPLRLRLSRPARRRVVFHA